MAARELPPEGGDTWFISAADAFERLDPPLKNSLMKLTATHSGSMYLVARPRTLRLNIRRRLRELIGRMNSRPSASGRDFASIERARNLYINPGLPFELMNYPNRSQLLCSIGCMAK